MHFEARQVALSERCQAKVARVAEWMQEHPGDEIRCHRRSGGDAPDLLHPLRAVDEFFEKRLAQNIGADQGDNKCRPRGNDRLVRGGRFEGACPAPVRLHQHRVYIVPATIVILVLLFQKHLVRGLTLGAIQG